MIDWHAFDLEELADEVRRSRPGPDAEKTVWAFEEMLRVARIDPELLGYVLAASVCLLARAANETPRDVLEQFFRRSVPGDEWRERYLPLFS